ncbi:MAG: DUF3662 domain-containing protein [Atopobiaceae bacterium]|nr:DUF3662 domain-containing protein [Atopobiaceae bacterium]
MPTHIEQELGLGPTTNRIRRWFRKLMPNADNSLDPLTVNYEVWRAMSKNIRKWPSYQEAPNYVEVLVSPEDWEDYWGIDTVRKEAGVSAYVKARIAEKGYWVAGEPQILVFEDDTIDMGDFDIVCQFAEPLTAEELARRRASIGHVPAYQNAGVFAYPASATNLLPADQAARMHNAGVGTRVYGGQTHLAQTTRYVNPERATPQVEEPVHEVEVSAVDVSVVDEAARAQAAFSEFEVDPIDVGPIDEVLLDDDDLRVPVEADVEDVELDEPFVPMPADDEVEAAEPAELVEPDEDAELAEDDASDDDVLQEESVGGERRTADLAQEVVEMFWGKEEESDTDAQPEEEERYESADVGVAQDADADEANDEAGQEAEPIVDEEPAGADELDEAEESAEDESPAEDEEPVEDEEPDGAGLVSEDEPADEAVQNAGIDVELSAVELPEYVPVPEPDFSYPGDLALEYDAASDSEPDTEPASEPESVQEIALELEDVEPGSELAHEPEHMADPFAEPDPYGDADAAFAYGPDLDMEFEPEPIPLDEPLLRPASTEPFVDPENPGYLYLIGRSAFRLEIHPGDCIGAVRWGEDVPEEVNVRLDADGFPYAEVMQCTIDVQNGRWCVTNHAVHGTRLTKATGERYLLGKSEPCPIDPDDILWLGHERPLRVEY